MSKLLIGIACRTMMHNSLYRLQLNANYVEPFTDRLVSTVIITNNDPDLLGTLQLCDGFLLPGGDDINPEYYGEENKFHEQRNSGLQSMGLQRVGHS